MNEPATLTLRDAAAAIAQGRLRSEALVEACLDRIERAQPVLNCFIRASAEVAREQARAADKAVKDRRAIGRIHGVPLAHKDMFPSAGHRIRYGSRVRGEFRATQTAAAVCVARNSPRTREP